MAGWPPDFHTQLLFALVTWTLAPISPLLFCFCTSSCQKFHLCSLPRQMLSLFKACFLAFSKKPSLSPAVAWFASVSLHSCCLNPPMPLSAYCLITPMAFIRGPLLHTFFMQCFALTRFVLTGALVLLSVSFCSHMMESHIAASAEVAQGWMSLSFCAALPAEAIHT